MATRPTQSVSGWASGGVIATSIPPAEVQLGQQAGQDVPAAWINLFGAWIGYFDDLSPADDVLAFREWECPDDDTYDLSWSDSVDGLFVGSVYGLSILADTATFTAGFDSGSGDTTTFTTNPNLSTGYVRTNATGWTIGVVATDPTTPADDAGITVDADSGDVTLFSDYGSVSTTATHTAGDFGYASPQSCVEAFLPGGGIASVAAGATATPDVNGALSVDSGSAGSGAVADCVLGRAMNGVTASASSSVTASSLVYSGLDGTGTLTFSIRSVESDGSVTTHASGTLTGGVSPASGTLNLTVSTAAVGRGACWMLTVNGNGTAADCVVASVGLTYTIDLVR
jgi:hypothetical protein